MLNEMIKTYNILREEKISIHWTSQIYNMKLRCVRVTILLIF